MTIRSRRSSGPEHGLILVFPDREGSLFSSAVNRFVDDVEERVDAALVTFALTNGRHPTVSDALAATAFAGCTSVVLVLLDERLSVPTIGRPTPAHIVRCRRDPAEVASTFEAAGADVVVEACA